MDSLVLQRAIASTGIVSAYAGSVAPDGALMCFGQAVSRAGFPALFAIIGATYGAGDGSTTFNVPDARGVVIGGKDNMGGTALGKLTTAAGGVDGLTLGAKGGAQSVALSAAQMPSHAHGVNDPSHAHSIADPGHAHTLIGSTAATSGNGIVRVDGGGNNFNQASTLNGTGIGIYGAATGISIQAAGSGTAHANVQPTLVLNFIIWT